MERNHLPLSAEITCRFRPKSGAGLLRFLQMAALTAGHRAEARAKYQDILAEAPTDPVARIMFDDLVDAAPR